MASSSYKSHRTTSTRRTRRPFGEGLLPRKMPTGFGWFDPDQPDNHPERLTLEELLAMGGRPRTRKPANSTLTCRGCGGLWLDGSGRPVDGTRSLCADCYDKACPPRPCEACGVSTRDQGHSVHLNDGRIVCRECGDLAEFLKSEVARVARRPGAHAAWLAGKVQELPDRAAHLHARDGATFEASDAEDLARQDAMSEAVAYDRGFDRGLAEAGRNEFA